MIAATAEIHGLTVVTRNVADFKAFGVPLLNPFKAQAGWRAERHKFDRALPGGLLAGVLDVRRDRLFHSGEAPAGRSRLGPAVTPMAGWNYASGVCQKRSMEM